MLVLNPALVIALFTSHIVKSSGDLSEWTKLLPKFYFSLPSSSNTLQSLFMLHYIFTKSEKPLGITGYLLLAKTIRYKNADGTVAFCCGRHLEVYRL